MDEGHTADTTLAIVTPFDNSELTKDPQFLNWKVAQIYVNQNVIAATYVVLCFKKWPKPMT